MAGKGKEEASRRFAVAKKICPLSLVTGKEAGSATNIYNTNYINSTKDEKSWAFGILSFPSFGHCCRINIFVYFYNVRNNWISFSYDAEKELIIFFLLSTM